MAGGVFRRRQHRPFPARVRRVLTAAAGATAHTLTFSVGVSVGASASKRVGLPRSVTASLTATVAKRPALARSVALTAAATAARVAAYVRAVSAVMTLVVTRSRRVSLARAVQVTPSVAAVKTIILAARSLSVGLTATAVRAAQYARSGSATIGLVVSVAKRVGIVRSVMQQVRARRATPPEDESANGGSRPLGIRIGIP